VAPAPGIVLDPLTDPRWGDLVEHAPGGSVFHHPAWLALLHATYRYEMLACCVGGGSDDLLAGLPVATVASRITGRRLVALPFSDLCPPLVDGRASAAAPAALAAALGELQRSRGMPLEVRGTGEVLEWAPPGERFHHHVLALERDVEAVRRRFAKSQVMRGVRRAQREGLRADLRRDRAGLASFYRLHVMTRHRLGVPTQPRRFILGLERLFDRGLGFALLVRRGEHTIAGAVFLTFRDVLTYKYGASDARFLALRPNNLLFMEAIRWGCEHGFRSLDFGRTHWGQESLRAFKLSWGPEERELRYRRLGGAEPAGASERLEQLLGAVIRRTPPLTGRVIGEVLYRHAG
jgi:CelD/BcsL family acetyltransferase involved in cellulose biosynthesis